MSDDRDVEMGGDKEKAPEDLKDAKVVTKYKTAAEITQQALQFVLSQLTPGKKIAEVCAAGDEFIKDKTSKIYNKGKVEKGVAFPVSISVNNIVGHFAPLPDHKAEIKVGDVVKIDLGTQVDGFVAVVAHTAVVGVQLPTGKAAEVIAAAYTASQLALRLLKPGAKNTAITDMIAKVAADYKVNPVQGVLSHEMKKDVIDGQKVILNKTDLENKVDEFEFQPNEVYAIDIVMSTGDGKPNESEEKTTIYKRAPDTRYNLKGKVSRQVFADIQKKYPHFPFHIRELDSKTRGFAIKECREHDLLNPYPVLYEKEGEIVAHFKFTALLMPNGTVQATGIPLDISKLQTAGKLKDEGLLGLLKQGGAAAGKKKKKKAKKGKKKPAGAGGAKKEDDEEEDDDDEDAEMEE